MEDNTLEDRFSIWLDTNKDRLELSPEAVDELVDSLSYMLGDASIGWEYDYQTEWVLPLGDRIGILLDFDPNIFEDKANTRKSEIKPSFETESTVMDNKKIKKQKLKPQIAKQPEKQSDIKMSAIQALIAAEIVFKVDTNKITISGRNNNFEFDCNTEEWHMFGSHRSGRGIESLINLILRR